MKPLLNLLTLDDESVEKIENLRKNFLQGQSLSSSQLATILQMTKFPTSFIIPFISANEMGVIKSDEGQERFNSRLNITQSLYYKKTNISIVLDNYKLSDSLLNSIEEHFIECFIKNWGLSLNKNISPFENIIQFYNLQKRMTQSEIKCSDNFKNSTVFLENFLKSRNLKDLINYNDTFIVDHAFKVE